LGLAHQVLHGGPVIGCETRRHIALGCITRLRFRLAGLGGCPLAAAAGEFDGLAADGWGSVRNTGCCQQSYNNANDCDLNPAIRFHR
jgi:hypothetical protein